MSVDYYKLRASVAQLVADVRDDPKVKERIAKEPDSTLKERIPEAAAHMQPDQIEEFARLVLEGGAQWDTLISRDAVQKQASAGLLKGGMLCPACRPALYAALAAAGLAGVIAAGATGGAAFAAIVAAATPVVVAATGMTAAAAGAAIQTALAGASLTSINGILNGIADSVCKQLGC